MTHDNASGASRLDMHDACGQCNHLQSTRRRSSGSPEPSGIRDTNEPGPIALGDHERCRQTCGRCLNAAPHNEHKAQNSHTACLLTAPQTPLIEMNAAESGCRPLHGDAGGRGVSNFPVLAGYRLPRGAHNAAGFGVGGGEEQR